MQTGTQVVAVLGAGSWGTALGVLLARGRHQVRLWGHDPEEIRRLQLDGENHKYLPGIFFTEGLTPTSSLEQAVDGADEVMVVVPSHAFGAVLNQMRLIRPDLAALCWATKGLEPSTRRLLHEVARTLFPQASLAAISGPTFAMEVAKGLPTAVTVAASESAYGERLAELLRGESFRAYTSTDIIGVEIGGAAKNIMAIAAGISDGLGFGANARAALITRGLAEITRLGLRLGGNPETFMGLAGLGDLVLTATDDQSRNRRMGLALARRMSVQEAKEQIGQEVEGIAAARDFYLKAQALGVEMPITEQTWNVLYNGLDAKVAVHTLLQRAQKAEGS